MRRLIVGVVAALVLAASTLAVAQQSGDQGLSMDRRMGSGAMCPRDGRHREQGMSWHRGSASIGSGMMGSGMMGWSRDRGMMGPGGKSSGDDQHQWLRSTALLSEEVKQIVEGRRSRQGNPNVKAGTVEEQDESTIVAGIVKREDSLVQRMEVDRMTGQMRPMSGQ